MRILRTTENSVLITVVNILRFLGSGGKPPFSPLPFFKLKQLKVTEILFNENGYEFFHRFPKHSVSLKFTFTCKINTSFVNRSKICILFFTL